MRSAHITPRQFWRELLAAFCSLERIQFAAPWRPRRRHC
jgi:hypothetical protein